MVRGVSGFRLPPDNSQRLPGDSSKASPAVGLSLESSARPAAMRNGAQAKVDRMPGGASICPGKHDGTKSKKSAADRCLKWLIGEMEKSPQRRPMPKEKYCEQAQELFSGLSERSSSRRGRRLSKVPARRGQSTVGQNPRAEIPALLIRTINLREVLFAELSLMLRIANERRRNIMSATSFTVDPDAALNQNQAAEFLGVSGRTLEAWRVRGGGPRYCKIGRAVRYQRGELVSFLEKHRTSSTTESDARGR